MTRKMERCKHMCTSLVFWKVNNNSTFLQIEFLFESIKILLSFVQHIITRHLSRLYFVKLSPSFSLSSTKIRMQTLYAKLTCMYAKCQYMHTLMHTRILLKNLLFRIFTVFQHTNSLTLSAIQLYDHIKFLLYYYYFCLFKSPVKVQN